PVLDRVAGPDRARDAVHDLGVAEIHWPDARVLAQLPDHRVPLRGADHALRAHHDRAQSRLERVARAGEVVAGGGAESVEPAAEAAQVLLDGGEGRSEEHTS